ncbi:TonB-dependent receptor plug domain-containing protein [Desulfogranum mediterraneum]|uniref:TonB-dependent receptor plug domain-containing protein n=1 Tax=Desulfogranum mediterraneum TaxID=160661 RepID=UPI00040B57F3|nr:TonB-dependent receptor [Desulfogranum mediterraneum]
MIKKYYPALFIPVLLCSQAQAVLAAEQASGPAMTDELVVTASRSAESQREVSANLTVINREELAQSAGRNVGELLAEKGLGHVQQYPGALTAIGIRGFRTDTHGNDLQGHVLVLLDGRRAGTGNVAKLMTRNVERIEIIRGPGAVQYGSAGMGGVVNVITRRGTENSLFVEAGGGSFDQAEGSIGGTVKQQGFDFAGAYTQRTYGDYETGGGDRFYNTGVDYESSLSANLGYSFSENNRLGVIVNRFEVDEAGNPGYLSQNDLDDTSDKKNYSIDGTYSGATLNDRYQWLVRYFFGKDENSWKSPIGSDPTGWDTGIPSSNETDQQGAQAQLTADCAFATLTAGFDWLDYEVENSWTPRKTTYSNPALFFLGKSALLEDRLTVNLGLRYDWYEVEVKEPAGRDEDQTRLTPKVGLAWMVSDELKLRAQYAEAFMMPSADQLAADFSSFGRRTVGNQDLDPEKSTTYEGGLDYGLGSLQAALTYFHTDFEDKIISSALADGSSSWQNLGDATIAGFEAELSYDLGEPFSWSWEVRPYLGMTILTEYEDKETGKDLLYVSGTNLAAGLVVNNGEGAMVRFNLAYSGKQDVEDWESGSFPTPIVELDSSTVADLVASYRFLESETYGDFTLRGEIRNLFDEEYAYVKGYPLPGISWFVGLRWQY